MHQRELHRILHYEPETGIFTRLTKTGCKGKIGAVVGGKNADGYVMIGINCRRYYAHRLAFIYMTGECPDLVDHIDQDKGNNSWTNLRAASRSVNAINSRRRSTNSSGVVGVSWHAAGRKWQAHCGPRYLGLFTSKDDACAAYADAVREAVA